ncbi:MAG: class I SAM-dependent methyltransferase [Myxococcota bacterium]
MADVTPDNWNLGDAYERYMGRWSRLIADRFLEWLAAPPSSHWLELGCGTGALSAAICETQNPASLIACDPSQPFIEYARARIDPTQRECSFHVLSTPELPHRAGGFDLAISGLVLNFLPDPLATLLALRNRTRDGGQIAAYVWDYRGGIEFLHHFWQIACMLDPGAARLDESRRFANWREDNLTSLFVDVGLTHVRSELLTIGTDFPHFDDFWQPFLGGVGPAPAYAMSLSPTQRETLRAELHERLLPDSNGHIRLAARAIAVRGQLT